MQCSDQCFFLPFRDGLVEDYDILFSGQSGASLTGIQQFGEKWGWYQSIYALSQGDIRRFENITQLNLHRCLTMLTFMKEKSDLESKQLKSKMR